MCSVGCYLASSLPHVVSLSVREASVLTSVSPQLLLLHVESVGAVEKNRLGCQSLLHTLSISKHHEPEVWNLQQQHSVMMQCQLY